MSLTTQATVSTVVRPLSTTTPRLLSHVGGREPLAAYRGAGGYSDVHDVEQLMNAVEASGLRGRGGAAFPAHVKLRSVRRGNAPPVVVANGEEGEPVSIKDRWLLRTRPHLVLDGLRLAALLTGADHAYVYLSDEDSRRGVLDALGELDGSLNVPIDVVRVEPTYVAGEETAAVRAINGGPALPTDKPPRPFEEGVGERPTLVSNVETLANFPLVHRLGAHEYRRVGTETSPGTFLLTLSGCASAGLYEVPFGVRLRAVFEWLGEDPAEVAGFLLGGYFAGILGIRAMETALDYDAMAAIGSGLGCGAVSVVRTSQCPVDASAAVMAYFARENSGQCGSCVNGTAAMSAVLAALRDHRAEAPDVARLRDWSQNLRGRGACGTLDGATNLARTLLREFPDLVTAHIRSACRLCRAGSHVGEPPFALALPTAAPA